MAPAKDYDPHNERALVQPGDAELYDGAEFVVKTSETSRLSEQVGPYSPSSSFFPSFFPTLTTFSRIYVSCLCAFTGSKRRRLAAEAQ